MTGITTYETRTAITSYDTRCYKCFKDIKKGSLVVVQQNTQYCLDCGKNQIKFSIKKLKSMLDEIKKENLK